MQPKCVKLEPTGVARKTEPSRSLKDGCAYRNSVSTDISKRFRAVRRQMARAAAAAEPAVVEELRPRRVK